MVIPNLKFMVESSEQKKQREEKDVMCSQNNILNKIYDPINQSMYEKHYIDVLIRFVYLYCVCACVSYVFFRPIKVRIQYSTTRLLFVFALFFFVVIHILLSICNWSCECCVFIRIARFCFRHFEPNTKAWTIPLISLSSCSCCHSAHAVAATAVFLPLSSF